MGFIIDSITEFIRDMLQGWVSCNLEEMFLDVNAKVGSVGMEVAQTPSSWNSTVFSLIRTLSDTVMIPIAGMVISYVLIYELISMVMDKNNMHEFDTGLFFRYIMKAAVAVLLLSKTTDIVLGIFDVGQYIVLQSTKVIHGSTDMNVSMTVLQIFQKQLTQLSIGELLSLALESTIVTFTMKIMSVLITVVLAGRMIEIYLYISVAPVPFATMTNKEWGSIGTNYLKGLIALAFQGFLIMVCVAIYSGLVTHVAVSEDLHSALWQVIAYTVVLCFALFKTGSVSKSLFNTH